MLRGDFGTSYQYNQDALSLVLERMPYSLQLAGVSLVASVLVGIVLGVAAAHFRNTPFDLLVNGFAALGQAMPGFWVAIMLILVFAVNLNVLPVSGSGSWKNLVLPAATLTVLTASKIIPLVRSNMIEVMQQDYIRTARSKGLSGATVIFKHAFKNTLVPVITIIAMAASHSDWRRADYRDHFCMAGPGHAHLPRRGEPGMTVVQAGVMAVAFITILANLISDIAYCLIDPTIKYQ